jgi:hypothetical protein
MAKQTSEVRWKLFICGLTLDVTGDQGKARRSRGTTLGVRVDGPVKLHFAAEPRVKGL